MTRGATRSEPGEDGQIMVMVIGYVFLSLLLATVVMAVSAAYIEHKKLLSVADGASAAAADSFTLGQVDDGAAGPTAVLSRERVRAVAESYLHRHGAYGRFDRLAIAPGTGTPDSATAEVALTSVLRPPVVSFLVPEGILIEATSTARSRLTR